MTHTPSFLIYFLKNNTNSLHFSLFNSYHKKFLKRKRLETKVCGFITKGFVNYRPYFCKRRTKWAYLAVIGVNEGLNNC